MLASSVRRILLVAYTLLVAVEFGQGGTLAVSTTSWTDYKTTYSKTYTNSAISEAYARYFYNFNTRRIALHNTYYANNRRTYTLKENQFTDMRLKHFMRLFPTTTQPTTTYATAPIDVTASTDVSFNPITDLGITVTVESQGITCNSGWAYATAKAVEIMAALQIGNVSPERMSAQSLIDCAGSSTACKSQVPQTAFDYLAHYAQDLYLESDYPNTNTTSESGMCIIPTDALVTLNLYSYSCITDGDEDTMKNYVAAGYPVVIEFDPTSFEFMHYADGVFQQPSHTFGGSHFMVVIGFGTDETSSLDYWLVMNSFGTTWGDGGFIKIARNAEVSVVKSACLPMQLV